MRGFYNIVMTLAVVVLVQSCYMDERLSFDSMKEGVPVRVTLGYSSSESIVETRAALPPEYENRIENIYLFVFNSAGERQKLLENLNSDQGRSSLFEWGGTGGLIPDNDNTSNGRGYLSFVCGSLSNATIVAIANVTTGNVTTAYTVTPAELDEIQTIDDLKAKVMTMEQPSVGRGALFMMTGYAKNEDGSTSIDISGSESGDETLSCTLKLERTDAKVEVRINSKVPEGKNWTDFSFRPMSWQVVNVPAQSFILPDDNGNDADGTYFSTVASELDTLSANENNTYYQGGVFTFYMPENLKKIAPGVTIDSYAEREEWITSDLPDGEAPFGPGHTVENVEFKNAPENATYLVITGELSYKDAKNYSVNADTRYFIHLGYEGGDCEDFLTKRNHYYKYTVTVQGINDIIVEVENDGMEEQRPGHEGNVIYTTNGFYEFDCHYDRRLISLSKDDLRSDDLSWGVSTPYSKGVHKVGETVPENLRDYRWIKFAVNSHYGEGSGQLVKYPGDQNYDDPYPLEGSANNQPSPYYNGGDGGNHPDARLMDIEQLLVYLKEQAVNETDIFDDNGNVYISVFVDEFLYTYDPLSTSPTLKLSLWKEKSVNQPDRLLYIVSDGAQFSPDGQSSVVSALYTFKQKSIRTIYNTDPSLTRLTTAWGLEAVMETDRLPVDKEMSQGANDQDNGRSNTLKYLENNLNWTSVLSTDAEGHYSLKDDFRNVFYACLMRNRDLDGDNTVDDDEIRWYLAAINQLTDIYIGEYALDYESRLYPYDPINGSYPPNGGSNSVYWHYASSTFQDRIVGVEGWWGIGREYWNVPYVLWAEEGPSKGNYKASEALNGANYAYRCVRNLGIELDNISDTPQDFVQPIEENTFDLSYLDPKALRDYYIAGAGAMPVHNEKSEHNLPYKQFEVTTKAYGDNYTWQQYQTSNPCASAGYRLPNLRELLIFTSRMENLRDPGGMIMSYTGFSMCDFVPYGEDRMGYSYNPDDGSMGPANHKGYVYGVRDLE